jgi:mono/diheme cytochrome c family protein
LKVRPGTTLLAASALAASAVAASAEMPVMRGQAILESKCSRCHAVGREDASLHADAPPFRDVAARYPPSDLSEALAEGIVSGHPDMPVFVFQHDEIDAIVAYLDTLAPR